MIGRFHADLTGYVACIAGQPLRLSMMFWQDRNKQSALDVTGYTAKCTLLNDAGTVLVASTTANGGITNGGTAGTMNVDSSGMSPAHSAIVAGAHTYAYELYGAGGALECYITGDLPFDTDVSP